MKRDQDIRYFEAPEDYAAFLRGIPHSRRIDNCQTGSTDEVINALEQGDITNLAAAQKILDKIDQVEVLSRGVTVLQPSIVGFAPCVPACIAGFPEAMYTRHTIDQPSPQSPIRVFVQTQVSSAVNHRELLERGIATLAFVLALECRRPVDLYVVTISGNSGTMGLGAFGAIVKVASKPMDIGRACYMLTANSYTRAANFATNNFLAGWTCHRQPWPYGIYPTMRGYMSKMRPLIGAEPDDIFLMGGWIDDTLMLTDPVAWVNKQLKDIDEASHADAA